MLHAHDKRRHSTPDNEAALSRECASCAGPPGTMGGFGAMGRSQRRPAAACRRISWGYSAYPCRFTQPYCWKQKQAAGERSELFHARRRTACGWIEVAVRLREVRCGSESSVLPREGFRSCLLRVDVYCVIVGPGRTMRVVCARFL
jgi:hypothetical protein